MKLFPDKTHHQLTHFVSTPGLHYFLKRSLRPYCLASILALNLSGTGIAQTLTESSPVQKGNAKRLSNLEATLMRAAPIAAWVKPDLIKLPDATSAYPVVVRLSDVQLYADRNSAVYVRRVMQVNESSLLSNIAQIEIPYLSTFQTLQIHALHILRGNQKIDKTASMEVRLLQQEKDLEAGILTGSVTASIVIDDLRVGDSVDLSYTIQGQNPVFEGNYFNTSSWDSTTPVLRKHISLNYPADKKISHKLSGPRTHTIQNTEERVGERRIEHYSEDMLKAVDYEPYAPPETNQFKQIQFSQMQSWNEVARWASQLFDYKGSSPALNELVNNFDKLSTPQLKVQKALEYTQNEIRYLSVSIGESSHKPATPDQVIEKRYGDCKDKSLLLTTLLRRMGIEAHPVLVATYRKKGISQLLPSPAIFDHAIVRVIVDGKTFFLDPTRNGQSGSLENMGQSHAEAEVLVVSPESRDLSIIGKSNARSENSRMEKVLAKQWNRPVEFILKQTYSGLEAEYARSYFARQTKEQIGKQFQGNILKRYPLAELKSGPVFKDDTQSNQLTLEMRFAIPEFFKSDAQFWYVSYQASNFRDIFYLPENPRRSTPLMLPSDPNRFTYQFEVELPDGFDANYRPNSEALNSPGFTLTENISFKGKDLTARLALGILKEQIPPMQVADFMAYVRKTSQVIDNTLKIRKTDIKENSLALLLDAPYKQRISDKLTRDLNALNQRVDNSNPDPELLCQRASLYARLRQFNLAQSDLQSLQKMKIQEPGIFLCRAQAYFDSMDMKNAEADWMRAGSKGSDNPALLTMRGLAAFSSAKWAEAAAQFSKALNVSENQTEKLRAEMLRLLSLKQIPAQSAQLSTTLSGNPDDWRSGLLDVITGNKSEEQMSKQLYKLTGDELDIALPEAYFVFAQLQTAQNNKLKAKVYLQRALDKAAPDQLLRPVIQIELDRFKR